MKKSIVIGFMLLLTTIAGAQVINSKEAKELKSRKIVVGLKEYPKKADADEKAMVDSVNSSLKYAMENYWEFSTVVDYLPLSEAKELVKSNKKTHCYITIDVGTSTSFKQGSGSYQYKYVSRGEKLSIYIPKMAATVYLPQYVSSMTKATGVYGVMQLQKMLDLLVKEELKSTMQFAGYIKDNGAKIINKTLLIPQEYISPKLSEDDIKLVYPYDLDICDLDKIEKVILDRDSKYAVAFFVPIPVGGKEVRRIFISNAEDGDIYGVADGNKISVDLGMFGTVGGSDKKYLINEKVLKQIGKIVD